MKTRGQISYQIWALNRSKGGVRVKEGFGGPWSPDLVFKKRYIKHLSRFKP